MYPRGAPVCGKDIWLVAATKDLTQSSETALALKREIEGATSVLIGSHLSPDGDALGSALAFSLLLDQMGVQNEVVCHHPPPANLRFLPGSNRIRQTPRFEKHDLGIILDLDSTERLGDTGPYFDACPRTVVIDHHVPHEAPGDLRIVDTSAAATAAILARLFLEWEVEISADMATCLLTGIVTDTGSFRFRNTTPESLHLSAQLLERGGDIIRVSEEIFQRKPLSSARLLGSLLEDFILECDGKLGWGALRLQDFEAAQATDEDTEGFVNELLSIDTVQIAAIFREPKPHKIRVSLRSRGDYDVASVAREFGGGGHRNAAGCSFDLYLDEVVHMLIPRLRKCLESS